MWGGLVLELEIVGAATHAIIDPIVTGGGFAAADTSIQWQIEDVRIVGDVCTLDSALQQIYGTHPQWKALLVNYIIYITM